MHRRSLIIVAIVAVLIVTGVTVGLWQARAQGEPRLTSITPEQLLANVAEHALDTTAVSGGLTWTNDVLGLSILSFGQQGTGDLASLLSNGSGRLWLQDGAIRFDVQGMIGDTVIVGDSAGVWVYEYAGNTAIHYALQSDSDSAGTSGTLDTQPGQSAETTVTDPVKAVNDFIRKLAPDATLAVADQVTVAGQDCYVLSLIPKAPNTILGSVQVAIDGRTYLPLKLDIYAKGTTKPVFTAGFTSISYSRVSDDIFAFTPPANATVERKTLPLPKTLRSVGENGGEAFHDGPEDTQPGTGAETPGHGTLLTLNEAAALAGFTPPAPQISDPVLAFAGATVIPAGELNLEPLLEQLGSGLLGSGSFDSGSHASGWLGSDSDTQPSTSIGEPAPQSVPNEALAGPVTIGPTVVQRYGQGFGTVVLIEAKVPAELLAQLDRALAGIPLLSQTDAGGVIIHRLDTALGSAALWSRDGLLFLAAGCIPPLDLTGFIGSVR